MTEYERKGTSIPEKVERLEETVYRYDGLNSRMTRTEERVKALEQFNIDSANRRETKINLILGAAFSALALLVVDLVMKIH